MAFTGQFLDEIELVIHFRKHRAEFSSEWGITTKEAYLARAVLFLGEPKPDYTLERLRPRDRDTLRYNYVTQEFGIVNEDGFILTYFILGTNEHGFSTNRSYFNFECSKRR